VAISAQTEERKLDISGQIRMRGEVDGKDFTTSTDPYDYRAVQFSVKVRKISSIFKNLFL
jgi:hypothetical protein